MLSAARSVVARGAAAASAFGRQAVPGGARMFGASAVVRSKKDDTEAWLVFEDGSKFRGLSFGSTANAVTGGEAVFNTGMVGYPENMTDPSYRGQILNLTFPLIGNYGVPEWTKDAHGLPKYFESDRIHVSGLVVADYSVEHSHWQSGESLSSWLQREGVPGIHRVDTREITKKIRDGGAMLAKIVVGDEAAAAAAAKEAFLDPNERNLVAEVSATEAKVYGADNTGPRILALDCGIKYNMIRELVGRNAQVTVAPWNTELVNNDSFDGLFLSNGPGNPDMCMQAIDNLKNLLAANDPRPVFGICMGNQLLSIAAGAKTYKMDFGNRGQNIPVTNTLTKECWISPQNHGYAVDATKLPEGWTELFVNENDFTNEGIMHETKPIFTAQFHPESHAGPNDTGFLFDRFLEMVNKGTVRSKSPVRAAFPVPKNLSGSLREDVQKVLLLGSGGLSIGQAGEFDYSGGQAIKALKEEKLHVVLMNPNIASVQTNVDQSSLHQADNVYFIPVTADYVEQVIRKERPDGIIISMGGQTALNVGVELFDSGVLDKYGVRTLGTSIDTVKNTEDRDLFANKLREIDEKMAVAITAETPDQAVLNAIEIGGFPVMIRSAYSLGGMGSGICDDEAELRLMASKALAAAPQILVERSMKGWKEVEYEVVRDAYDNCVTVCNMENFDPMGIHTGESIVIAPSQTLSNAEYHMLRDTAIRVVRHLGIVGECNIQYALNPHSMEYCIIEVNARLSRSSALASKATGYPLAFVAAKLALGIPLPELRNSVTKTTTACFEPSLDYVVTKIPRWDLKKFAQVKLEIGSQMKSVGEVMSIGRTWEESIQKAIRMVDPSAFAGFESIAEVQKMDDAALRKELAEPTDLRIFAIARVLNEDIMDVDEIHDITKIDRWFLYKLQNITEEGKTTSDAGSLAELEAPQLRRAKEVGFSDEQIARMVGDGSKDLDVRASRLEKGIVPYVKQIDTLAAEYPAQTNYLYMTYNGTSHDIAPGNKEDGDNREGIVTLGSGAYRIGSSVEFDWCAVSAIRTLREIGKRAIMINYNPETVSTDYDECDRLYFEELSLERVLDVYQHEDAGGAIISVGGQIPQNLAVPLLSSGVNILGTKPEKIDNAEDRSRFSDMLDDIGVDQPAWNELQSIEQASEFADRVGYPVLVRPSYVLSGAAMKVIWDGSTLNQFLNDAVAVSKDHPVVLSKFIDGCKEIEMDGVADNGIVVAHAVHEHIENGGVHSGDATLVLPPVDLSAYYRHRVNDYTARIVKALEIHGPFNIQFLAKDSEVKVIECNLRASRSVPFVSKTVGKDFVSVATKVMCGDLSAQERAGLPHLGAPVVPTSYVGIKYPMFSYHRLPGADPVLGVEMASTGEVACFGEDTHEAFLKALLSGGFRLPARNILLSVQDKMMPEFVHDAFNLEQLGYKLFSTPRTHEFLANRGMKTELVTRPLDGDSDNNSFDLVKEGGIDMVINMYDQDSSEKENNYALRRASIDFSVPLLTNANLVHMFVAAMAKHRKNPILSPKNLFEYYDNEEASEAWTDEKEFH